MDFLDSNESPMAIVQWSGIEVLPTPSLSFSLNSLRGSRFVPGCSIWNCPGWC